MRRTPWAAGLVLVLATAAVASDLVYDLTADFDAVEGSADNISTVIRGKDDAVHLALLCLVAWFVWPYGNVTTPFVKKSVPQVDSPSVDSTTTRVLAAVASSGSRKLNASTPKPFLAATLIVSRLVQAIHMGGWGF